IGQLVGRVDDVDTPLGFEGTVAGDVENAFPKRRDFDRRLIAVVELCDVRVLTARNALACRTCSARVAGFRVRTIAGWRQRVRGRLFADAWGARELQTLGHAPTRCRAPQ